MFAKRMACDLAWDYALYAEWLQDDVCFDSFSPVFIGDAHRNGFLDFRMLEENLVDLSEGNVKPSGDNQIRLPDISREPAV
jgi:hypothetical protein